MDSITKGLTFSNESLFLTCWAMNFESEIVFSMSLRPTFSNDGLLSLVLSRWVAILQPVGLYSSSSPPGSGIDGNGGSPKQGPIPPAAATSNRVGGGKLKSNESKVLLHLSSMDGTWMTSVSTLSESSLLSLSSLSFLGRSIKRNLGSTSMKNRRTHGASLCVTGDLKIS